MSDNDMRRGPKQGGGKPSIPIRYCLAGELRWLAGAMGPDSLDYSGCFTEGIL
jgi:hypothetical protein